MRPALADHLAAPRKGGDMDGFLLLAAILVGLALSTILLFRTLWHWYDGHA